MYTMSQRIQLNEVKLNIIDDIISMWYAMFGYERSTIGDPKEQARNIQQKIAPMLSYINQRTHKNQNNASIEKLDCEQPAQLIHDDLFSKISEMSDSITTIQTQQKSLDENKLNSNILLCYKNEIESNMTKLNTAIDKLKLSNENKMSKTQFTSYMDEISSIKAHAERLVSQYEIMNQCKVNIYELDKRLAIYDAVIEKLQENSEMNTKLINSISTKVDILTSNPIYNRYMLKILRNGTFEILKNGKPASPSDITVDVAKDANRSIYTIFFKYDFTDIPAVNIMPLNILTPGHSMNAIPFIIKLDNKSCKYRMVNTVTNVDCDYDAYVYIDHQIATY